MVHFYNTRDKLPPCNIPGNPNPTAEEAMANKPPAGQSPNLTTASPLASWHRRADVVAMPVGDLGLTKDEELAVVAYVKTLADIPTASAP